MSKGPGQADSPTPKVQPDPIIQPKETPQDHSNDEVPKRIFWTVPNFMKANDQAKNKGPLTPREKCKIVWHQFWDEIAYFGNVIQASISQAADGIPHYGQGWGAFGKRYLAPEGDQFTDSMLIYSVLPHALRQDRDIFARGTVRCGNASCMQHPDWWLREQIGAKRRSMHPKFLVN